jgi:murein DD-endopeptidase MepM/ murein hydrolase activator NlpD
VMAEQEEKKEKKKFKLNRKYTFLMSQEDTLEPVVDFKVNLLNLVFLFLGIILILMVVTTLLIAFTPLREYIPGYTEKSSLERKIYELYRRTDSIERELQRKDIYFNNLKLVIEGYDFENDSVEQKDIYAPFLSINTDTLEIKKSVQDSALRAEFEEANLFALNAQSNLAKRQHLSGVANFFTPVTGKVINEFNSEKGHYGIDIAAADNQLITATLDGTVIYASWTIDQGYTIGIQHENNYFSTYKHNATLLKKEGDFVKAGEAIAILGESGDQSTVPHLHFELWHNGIPLNPNDYIKFEKNIEE